MQEARPQDVPLTRKQRDIIDYFRDYRRSQRISPTLEEIARHFKVSKVTVFQHVEKLIAKGLMARGPKGVSRNLRLLVDGPEGCPTCGHVATQ